MEGDISQINNPTTSLFIEKRHYQIDPNNIVDQSSVPAFANAPGGTYPNNNGNPPYNNNPNSNVSATSQKIYAIGGDGEPKTGLSTVLRVMSGDDVSIFAKSFMSQADANDAGNGYPITDFFTNFILGLTGVGPVAASGHGNEAFQFLNNTTTDPGGLLDWVNTKVPQPANAPKAYLNWILFDEHFHVVASCSGFDPIGVGYVKSHNITVPTITKNGYLYVYGSNETDAYHKVYFDNLQVIHTKGPLVEETHYYPFGLTMAGISSKAAGSLEEKKKFQGQEFAHNEFSDGAGLEMYEFKYRMDDPQIGRFWQIDPLSDKYVYNSTYAFSENHVISHVELEGLEKHPVNPEDGTGTTRMKQQLEAKGKQTDLPQPPITSNKNEKKSESNSSNKTSFNNSNESNPIIGQTATNKIPNPEINLVPTALGDKIEVSSYQGKVTGSDGGLVNVDVSSSNDKFESISVTHGVATVGFNSDLSVSLGLGAFGVEGHIGIGLGVGLGQLSAGGSYTNKDKVIKGGDLTVRPGAGSVVAAAAAVATYFLPIIAF